MPYDDYENEGSLAQKTFLKEPDDYKVILLNDDFTTMEFVVQVLQSVFHLGAEEAEKVMMSVHKTGSGVAGIYTTTLLPPGHRLQSAWQGSRAFRLDARFKRHRSR